MAIFHLSNTFINFKFKVKEKFILKKIKMIKISMLYYLL